MDDNADAGEFLCVIDDEGNKFQVCKGRVLYGFVLFRGFGTGDEYKMFGKDKSSTL